jgi:hypothetical protein
VSPFREYNFTKHHIIKEFFFHVWGCYFLGLLVGALHSNAFGLNLLFSDRTLDSQLIVHQKNDIKFPKTTRNYAMNQFPTIQNTKEGFRGWVNLHDKLLFNGIRELRYKPAPLLYFVGVILIFLGIKGLLLDFKSECFGFLSETDSYIFGAFFLVIGILLILGVVIWALFTRRNRYTNRMDAKYFFSLVIFVLQSFLFVYLLVVTFDMNKWYGLFFLLISGIIHCLFYFWIGYVGFGIVYVEVREMGYEKRLQETGKMIYIVDFQNTDDVVKLKEKSVPVWFYRSFLNPFDSLEKYTGTFGNSDRMVIGNDRIQTKNDALIFTFSSLLIVWVIFGLAWVVNVITQDSDSVLFTIFALSLVFLFLIPIFSFFLPKK